MDNKLKEFEKEAKRRNDAYKEMLAALTYYKEGIDHFYKCINFGASFLDSDAITFMNKSNLLISKALSKATGKQ